MRKQTLYLQPVKAGFPSPAEGYVDKSLDLNEFLIKNPHSTYFLRVSGDSMSDYGIFDGDIVIVDKNVEPVDGKIVIASVNGEFTIKVFHKKNDKILLLPGNKKYKPIEVEKSDVDFVIWGVVRHSIRSFH